MKSNAPNVRSKSPVRLGGGGRDSVRSFSLKGSSSVPDFASAPAVGALGTGALTSVFGSVAVAGLDKIKFELARKCNLDVAKLVADCTEFRGKPFYPLTRVLYSIDQKFAVSVRPETVAVVDGVPNLIFLQPRKNATPWAYNAGFLRRILEETYMPDYFDVAKFWLVDTEADIKGNRHLQLVDLQTVSPMSEREFIRRIASLRAAWRLHLTDQSRKPSPPKRPDGSQPELDLGSDDLN